jgi:hypothetical protein
MKKRLFRLREWMNRKRKNILFYRKLRKGKGRKVGVKKLKEEDYWEHKDEEEGEKEREE